MRLILIFVCIVSSCCAEVANFSIGDSAANISFENISSNEQTISTGDGQTTSGDQTITATTPLNTTALIPDESSPVNQNITSSIQDQTTEIPSNIVTSNHEQASSETQAITMSIFPNISVLALDQSTSVSNPDQTTSEIVKPLTVIITPTLDHIYPTIPDKTTTGIQNISTPYNPPTIRHSTAASNLFPSAQMISTSKRWQITKTTSNWGVPNATTAEQNTTSASTTHHAWHDKQRGQKKSSHFWPSLIFFLVVCLCLFASIVIAIQNIFDSSSEYQVVHNYNNRFHRI